MNRLLVCLVSLPALGCMTVEHIAPTTSQLGLMQGQRLAIASPLLSELALVSLAKAAIPLYLGTPSMYSDGQAMIEKYSIPNPATVVVDAIVEPLSKMLQLTPVRAQHRPKDDNSQALAVQFAELAPYVLDFRTLDWAFNYRMPDVNRFRVGYQGRLRVLDTRSGAVILQLKCTHVTIYSTRPAYAVEELVANDAAIMKSETVGVANDCANSLLESLKR